MSEPKLQGKSHDIPKKLVWSAWLKVKENGGAAGVDGVTIEQFEERLKENLYKLWNRMSSGSYFPGPVRGVEIPKDGGGGGRLLGGAETGGGGGRGARGARGGPAGGRSRRRRGCWSPGWSGFSTGTVTATGRGAAPTRRWLPAAA